MTELTITAKIHTYPDEEQKAYSKRLDTYGEVCHTTLNHVFPMHKLEKKAI